MNKSCLKFVILALLFSSLITYNGELESKGAKYNLASASLFMSVYQFTVHSLYNPVKLIHAPQPLVVYLNSRHNGHSVERTSVSLNQRVAGGELSKFVRTGVIYTLLAIFMGSIFAWFMRNRTTRKLSTIQETITAFHSGNHQARSKISGDDEVVVLAREFNSLLDALDERDSELRTSEKNYRSLIQKVQTAILLHDAQGRILKCNPMAADLLGFTEGQLIGKSLNDPQWHFLREDGSVMSVAEYPTSLVISTKKSLRGYVKGIRKQGSHEAIWVLVNAEPEFDDTGAITTVIVSFVDITERRRAEAELRASEKALKEAQRIAHLGTWYIDLATNEVFWSEVLYNIYGLEPALSPPLYTESMKLFTPESWKKLSSSIAQTTKTGIPYEIELESVREDDSRRWMWTRGELVRDTNGNPVRIRGVVMDITERKFAEEKLRESEKKFKTMTDTSPLAIYMSSGNEQKADYMNPTFTRLFGYTLDEVPTVGEWWPLAYPDETYRKQIEEEWQQKVGRAIESSSQIEPMETIVTCKDGTLKNIQWEYISTGVQNWAFGLDITERKQAEEELRRSENGLAEAQRMAHLGNWNLDLVNNVLTWSDEIYRIFEIDSKKFGASYEAFLNAIHPEDREMVNTAYTESVQNRIPYNIVHRLQMDNGRIKYVNEKCETYYAEDGTPSRSIGTVHDITQQVIVEQKLQDQEKKSQSLLRLSRRLEQTEFYSEALGVAQEEMREILDYKNLWAYLVTEDKQFAHALFAGCPESDYIMSEEGTATIPVTGDKMMEEIVFGKRIVIVEDAQTDDRVNKEIVREMGNRTIINVPIILSDRLLGSIGTGTFGDEGILIPSTSEQEYLNAMASHLAVTFDRIRLNNDRKRAEQELQEKQNQLIEAQRIAHISNWWADLITGELYWSDEFFRILGREVQKPTRELALQWIHPEDLPGVLEDMHRSSIGPNQFEQEFRIIRPDGEIRWIHNRWFSVFDEDGNEIKRVGTHQDITERKQVQEKILTLNEELEQRVAERTAQLKVANKELEAFAYSVSHDLRAPLRHIDGYVDLLVSRYGDSLDEKGQHYVNTISSSARQMGILIDDLLQFSRTGRAELHQDNLNMTQVLGEVLMQLKESYAGRNIEWIIGELPFVRGDFALLRQVWANLLENAIKYTRPREVAQIEVSTCIENEEIIFSVKDNGVGFDMQYAGKLFGVFQRLHSEEEFEGSGIGLATVKRIINRHGGRVWAEAKVDEGATFYFSLPAGIYK